MTTTVKTRMGDDLPSESTQWKDEHYYQVQSKQTHLDHDDGHVIGIEWLTFSQKYDSVKELLADKQWRFNSNHRIKITRIEYLVIRNPK